MQTLFRYLFSTSDGNKINNDTSKKLLKFYKKNKNNVNSPTSLIQVLSLLLYGLSDSTLDEVCISFGIDKFNLNTSLINFKNMYILLRESKCVTICNYVLSKSNVELNKSFISHIKNVGFHEYFSSENSQQIVSKINSYVNNDTKGMIKELLQPNDINDETFMIILNTIYFKSNWLNIFEKRNTKKELFYTLPKFGETRQENLMFLQDSFKYYETSTYKIINMPYEGNGRQEERKFSFVAVLPLKYTEEATIFDHLQLESLMRKMNYVTVNVKIPKFEMEQELDLIPFFKMCGISELFTDMKATNMTNVIGRKYINTIKQKVKVIIDENGTEASASTQIICINKTCSIYDCPKKIYNFTANHSFSWYIIYQDKLSESPIVLFSGIYV